MPATAPPNPPPPPPITAAAAAVVVEADFPDAFRINMYVRGLGSDKTAQEALGDFKRFPTW